MGVDLAARVRAARAYAGLTQTQLGAALQQDAQTVKRTEGGKRTPKEPELLAIARACDLPYAFFTADFDRLDEIARIAPEYAVVTTVVGDQEIRSAAALEGEVAALRELVLAVMHDETIDWAEAEQRARARKTTQSLGAALDAADAEESEAAASTRDEADASQEATATPARATPRSARRSGG